MGEGRHSGPEKVYAYGDVVLGKEVIAMLVKCGGTNTRHYQGHDPDSIYYIDRNGEIACAPRDSDVGYIIMSSSWTRLEPKRRKKEHLFLIRVREGDPSCTTCHLNNGCSDDQATKCRIAGILSEFSDGIRFDGRSLTIEEVDMDDTII